MLWHGMWAAPSAVAVVALVAASFVTFNRVPQRDEASLRLRLARRPNDPSVIADLAEHILDVPAGTPVLVERFTEARNLVGMAKQLAPSEAGTQLVDVTRRGL